MGREQSVEGAGSETASEAGAGSETGSETGSKTGSKTGSEVAVVGGAGRSREDVVEAFRGVVDGVVPAVTVRPSGRRRLAIRADRGVQADGVPGVVLSLAASRGGDRAGLLDHGWGRSSTASGSPLYQRPPASSHDALDDVLGAYAIVYGEVGDARGWDVVVQADRPVRGIRARAHAGNDGGLLAFLGLAGVIIAGLATVATVGAESLLDRDVRASAWVAAWVVAAIVIVTSFFGLVWVEGQLPGRREPAKAGGSGLPFLLAIGAGSLAAWLVLRSIG